MIKVGWPERMPILAVPSAISPGEMDVPSALWNSADPNVLGLNGDRYVSTGARNPRSVEIPVTDSKIFTSFRRVRGPSLLTYPSDAVHAYTQDAGQGSKFRNIFGEGVVLGQIK